MGNDRSVCPESSGLHARNNGRDNRMRLREEEPTLETLSKFRLRAVARPHDAGFRSNRVSLWPGEYVPEPCTHCPSSQPSRA